MNETQLFLSRLDDAVEKEFCGEEGYFGFLNEAEISLACSYLKNRGVDFTLYGGYPQATRMYLRPCAVCDLSQFPVSSIKIVSKGNRELSHRDFLGSIMGLGIKRECIGDIVITAKNEAVVFVRDEILPHILRDLDKVARDRVVVSEYFGNTDLLSSQKEELRIIVSSLRVDNVLSSIVNCSRTKAVDLISDDRVFVNYLQVKKPSIHINECDVISIRGYGKYIIGETLGKSRRDNTILNVLHYI